METRLQFKERLQQAGLWDSFVREREALKASGVSGQDAWKQLRPKYSGLQPVVATAPEPLPVADAASSDAQASGAAVAPAVTYETLALAAKGRKAAKPVEMNWVQEHMVLPLADIDPASVPSAGAVALLRWAKEGGGAADFFTSLFKSQLPSKKELDAQAAMVDDGRECVGLIEKLQRLRAQRVPNLSEVLELVESKVTDLGRAGDLSASELANVVTHLNGIRSLLGVRLGMGPKLAGGVKAGMN